MIQPDHWDKMYETQNDGRADNLLEYFNQGHYFTSIFFLQACGKFINSNFVTKQAQSSSKSPELLARYCDSLLKKR